MAAESPEVTDVRSGLIARGLVVGAEDLDRIRGRWGWFVPLLALGVPGPGRQPRERPIGFLVAPWSDRWASCGSCPGGDRADGGRRRVLADLRRRHPEPPARRCRGWMRRSAGPGPGRHGVLMSSDPALAMAVGPEPDATRLPSVVGRSGTASAPTAATGPAAVAVGAPAAGAAAVAGAADAAAAGGAADDRRPPASASGWGGGSRWRAWPTGGPTSASSRWWRSAFPPTRPSPCPRSPSAAGRPGRPPRRPPVAGERGAARPDRLAALAHLAERVDAPLVSEHIAFVRAGGVEAGPPPARPPDPGHAGGAGRQRDRGHGRPARAPGPGAHRRPRRVARRRDRRGRRSSPSCWTAPAPCCSSTWPTSTPTPATTATTRWPCSTGCRSTGWPTSTSPAGRRTAGLYHDTHAHPCRPACSTCSGAGRPGSDPGRHARTGQPLPAHRRARLRARRHRRRAGPPPPPSLAVRAPMRSEGALGGNHRRRSGWRPSRPPSSAPWWDGGTRRPASIPIAWPRLGGGGRKRADGWPGPARRRRHPGPGVPDRGRAPARRVRRPAA